MKTKKTINSLKNNYQKDGHVLLKNFLDPNDVKGFKDILIDLINYHLRKEGIKSNDPVNDGLIKLDRKNHKAIVAIYETLRNSDALCRIVYNQKLLSAVKEILGLSPDQAVYLAGHSCRIDPPRDERFTYKWHQQSYYSIREAAEVQLWTPMIARNTKEKGTLSILLKSHKKELSHHLERNPGGHEQMFIPDETVKGMFVEKFVEIDPGDVILFHPYMIHRSNHNSSKQVRYSMIASYANPFDKRFKLGLSKEDIEDIATHNKKRAIVKK